MKKYLLIFPAIFVCYVITIFGQIPTNILVNIVKAEDERRWDATLENLLKSPDEQIRLRATLAVGRIGDENSLPALNPLLANDTVKVRAMAAFAIGEIESIKGADAILKTLKDEKNSSEVRARAVEAAGKIIAANPKDALTPELGKAILATVDFEDKKRSRPDDEIILLGLTAILRAHPEGGEKIASEFLHYSNPRIRADALNTLARLRSKIVNDQARKLLRNDTDPIVRANAARMLGVGEDKTAIDLLLNAATQDKDSRVRVSAIRALGSLKDGNVAHSLIVNGESLLKGFTKNKSDLLEIATTLGRLLPNTNNQQAINFLQKLRESDKYESPETEIAFAKIAPEIYVKDFGKFFDPKANITLSWRGISSVTQGLAEFANLPDDKKFVRQLAAISINTMVLFQPSNDMNYALALPDILRALVITRKDLNLPPMSDGKVVNNDEMVSRTLRGFVKYRDKSLSPEKSFMNYNTDSGYFDPIVRATAAELLAEQPVSKENIEALKIAFNQALLNDKQLNDAQLAILDALFKLDKKESVGTLLIALNAPDYLVRQKAFKLLKTEGLDKDFPGLPTMLESFMAKKKNQVLPYAPAFGTKLGQILNTNADYIRALSRKNGTVKAVVTTSKGSFTIDFFPEDAPLTVDNFIKLAKSNYFNGVSVHRVVPNFVMQDGDPRGDGNGGPGWEIRCEINMLPYERGAVGMALSGKDTGGSQWFVTHSPQPHLDGGYTVFGKVNETDMKIVDSIVRGDKILNIKIIEPATAKRN